MTTTRLLFVRHGQSTGNLANLWTSVHHGYPLTELGHEQARAAGERLRAEGVDALYCSHVERAVETAAEIGAVLGLEPVEIDGIHELDVGIHEGRHDDEVAPIAQDVFTAWLVHEDLSGGFEGGETGAEVVARFRKACELLVAADAGRTLVVVSHGGALALGLGAMCDNLSTKFVGHHILHNCDVVEVEHRGDGGWHCVTWAGMDPTSE